MDAQPPETHASPPPAPTTPPLKPRRGGPLSGPAGLAFAIALLALAAFLTYRVFYQAEPDAWQPTERMFVCSESGRPFKYAISIGENFPVASPFSRTKTGYPAEPCYWSKDGKLMEQPVTWVILNKTLNKDGDTKCPECGRVVVGHNAEATDRYRKGQASSQAASQPGHP